MVIKISKELLENKLILVHGASGVDFPFLAWHESFSSQAEESVSARNNFLEEVPEHVSEAALVARGIDMFEWAKLQPKFTFYRVPVEWLSNKSLDPRVRLLVETELEVEVPAPVSPVMSPKECLIRALESLRGAEENTLERAAEI